MCLCKSSNTQFQFNEAKLFTDHPTRILHAWFGESNERDMYVLKKMKRFIIRMKLNDQVKNNIMSENEYSELFG